MQVRIHKRDAVVIVDDIPPGTEVSLYVHPGGVVNVDVNMDPEDGGGDDGEPDEHDEPQPTCGVDWGRRQGSWVGRN